MNFHDPTGEILEDRYYVETLVARGNMGRIYKAQYRDLNRTVAIKILDIPNGRPSDDTALARFRREATILANLFSPFIVKVHDHGVWKNHPYLVMELVGGRPLSDLIKEGPLPISLALRVARQTLRGLSVVHAAGIIHRDIKTSNVMIQFSKGSGSPHVKLLDFGLAKSLQEQDGELTQHGTIMGTPMCIPPEAIRGESIDLRADIYAMGVLLYQAVSGRSPFAGRTTVDLLASILRDPPRPLKEANPAIDVPPALEWTIMTCLAKEPDGRFTDVQQLDRALAFCQRYLDHIDTSPTMKLTKGEVTFHFDPWSSSGRWGQVRDFTLAFALGSAVFAATGAFVYLLQQTTF